MRYITDTTEFQIEEPTIVTLGKFDGRHRGHQKLLRTMKELKQELGYPTAIFTFSIAPLTQMSGQPQTVITTNMERRANMERMGIDYLVEYPFDEEIRRMSPEDFVKDILAGRMGAREIVVGPDCSFGYQGAGNAGLLKHMEKELGYRLHVIEKEKDHMRDISSTYIREELEKGNVEKANALLGALFHTWESSPRQPHRFQHPGVPHRQLRASCHEAPAPVRGICIQGAGG